MKKLEQRVPNLRFKGFTNDWEQRKLGDISTRVLRKNKDLQSTLPLTISAQEGLVDQTTFFHKQVASKQLSNYILLFKGEFAYNKSYSEGYPFGAIKRPNKYSKGVLSTLYIVFKPKNVNSDFLEHYYDTSKWYREIYRNAAEGARNHGLLNISAKDFFGTMLYIPQKNEQALIANVLDHLDSLIALQQRKLDLLKQLKKGMLQKMFADKGSKRPILRFNGFTDDWEQRKLGDVGKTQSGIGFPNKEQGGKKGVPFFKVSDMNNKGNEFEMISSNNYVTESQIDNKKWKPISNVPAVIFAKVGAALMLNRKRLVKVPFLIDNNTMAYIFNDEWDSYFGKVLFDTINLPKYAQTGALPSFNGSDIQNITVMLPSKDEQQRISQFFKVINKLITLHQRKQNHLKLLKKSLLQQMFM